MSKKCQMALRPFFHISVDMSNTRYGTANYWYRTLFNLWNASTYVFPFLETDACLSSPCVNGATCSDVATGYTCACVAGFTGRNCETGYLIF